MKDIIKISDERINAILPQNIKDSEVLNKTDKKVLGAILHYFLALDKAKMDKFVILSNEELGKSVGVRKADALSSVQNLIELNIIKRIVGKSRTEGEKAKASEYYVIWDNLKKPIKKPTFDDLFSSFLSSETPMGTAVPVTVPVTVPNSTMENSYDIECSGMEKVANMGNDNYRHQKGDATKNIVLLSTIYTMEFLKSRCPDGLSPEDMNDGVLDEMRAYITKRMNERSDNGTTEMNDTISSTLENTINTMENDPNPAPASQTQNKAAGEPQTSEVEQLSTEEEIKRQEARKEEIRRFNAGHDEHRKDICHNVKSTADYERFYGLLQKDMDYVKNSDWVQKQKGIWFNSFNEFWDKCEPYIKKNLNKVQKREKRRMQKEEEKRSKNSNTTAQQPIRHLEKSIKPIDVAILEYWINEREKANTQEQKSNAQNMVDTVLSEWSGKYDAVSIAKVCQECNLKASGEHQTAKVEQLPTKGKTTQYKPLEEECGDFVNDNLKIYCISKPSAQVAN